MLHDIHIIINKDNEIREIEVDIDAYMAKINKLNNILIEIKEFLEDIKSNYFKRYDDEVYKLCDCILEKIEEVDK